MVAPATITPIPTNTATNVLTRFPVSTGTASLGNAPDNNVFDSFSATAGISVVATRSAATSGSGAHGCGDAGSRGGTSDNGGSGTAGETGAGSLMAFATISRPSSGSGSGTT